MSRIGQKEINIPAGVTVEVKKPVVKVKGAKGELVLVLPDFVEITQEKNSLKVAPVKGCAGRQVRTGWGTAWSHLTNAIKGVSEGFGKKLEVNGVGFKAAVQGQKLVLNLGFSHPIEYAIPEKIEVKVDKNIIEISGADRQRVGQVAADIRSFRPPEPYKGKGIKYQDEHIRRKEMKKALAEGEGTAGGTGGGE